MADTSVAAVVVNWNGRDLLAPCLDSLRATDYKELSIIVVDNGSTDGSVELIREQYPDITLVSNSENVGYARAANAGLEQAVACGADYALLLNNDVEVAPDAVATLVTEAEKHPRAALLGPMIYYHDRPDVIWSAGGEISFWSGHIRHVGIREVDRGQFAETASVDYVTGCAVLVSLPALEDIGPMDTGYFMYNEDTDWCVRATAAGYQVLAVRKARIWHKVSMSSGGGLTSFKVYNRLRSTLRFFTLHARPYHWLGIIPATSARTCVFVVRELFCRRPSNAVAVLHGTIDSAFARERGR